MSARRYRVAQWGTGNVGLHALRSIMEHPRFDLVGVKVYSQAKAGRDAGELCGLPPVGIAATLEIEDILAARPDCVVYMSDRPEIDVLCRLLDAGINIATSLTDFNHRDSIEPDVRQRLEQACVRGRSSLYASGSTPGYSTEILPFAFTSIMRRIDAITQTEAADVSSRNSPEMLFDLLGFGKTPEAIARSSAIDPTTGLAPSMRMTCNALGMPLDAVTCTHEYAVARRDVDIAAGRVPAGTIAAMRMEIIGTHAGQPFFTRRATWFVSRDIEPAWDLPDQNLMWHYSLSGDVPLEISMSRTVSETDYARMSPGLTANPVINAIPFVCAAEPGLQQTDDLPILIGDFGRP
jgi:hypothetical protein